MAINPVLSFFFLSGSSPCDPLPARDQVVREGQSKAEGGGPEPRRKPPVPLPGRGLGRDQGGRRDRGQPPRPGGGYQAPGLWPPQHRPPALLDLRRPWPPGDHVPPLRWPLQHRGRPRSSAGPLHVSPVRHVPTFRHLTFKPQPISTHGSAGLS